MCARDRRSQNYLLWAHGGEADGICELLKLFSCFLTLWLLLFLYIYYTRKFEQMKLANKLLPQDTLASSGLLWSTQAWSFLPEAMMFAVRSRSPLTAASPCPLCPSASARLSRAPAAAPQPRSRTNAQVCAPPFVNYEVDSVYYDHKRETYLSTVLSSDEICTVLMMFFRSILLLRWLTYLSGLETHGSRLYANLNHLHVNQSLSLRLAFRRFPFRLIIATFGLLLSMLAFTMQVAEHRVTRRLEDYFNCVWLVLISMTGVGYGDVYPQSLLGRLVSTVAIICGTLLAMLTVMAVMRGSELTKAETRVNNMLEQTRDRRRLKSSAAFYIQAAWGAYLERLQRSQSALNSASLMGNEPLHADPKFCHAMRRFRSLRKTLASPDDDIQLIFKELLDSRTRVEGRLRDVEEKLDEMDAKFEHNIAAMNELLQKNLKYLRHVAA